MSIPELKSAESFLCAVEQFLELLKEHGQLPNQPDIACDLSDFPWYGMFDRPETPPPDQSKTDCVSGTKPSRNFSYSFKAATVSQMLRVTDNIRCSVRDQPKAQSLSPPAAAQSCGGEIPTKCVIIRQGLLSKEAFKNLLKPRGSEFIIAVRWNMRLFGELTPIGVHVSVMVPTSSTTVTELVTYSRRCEVRARRGGCSTPPEVPPTIRRSPRGTSHLN